jgi:hypothetical protein
MALDGQPLGTLPLKASLDFIIGRHKVADGVHEDARASVNSMAAILKGLDGPNVATLAELSPDLDWPEGALGRVFGDTLVNRGTYRKSGAPGAGSWVRIGDLSGYGDPNATASLVAAVNARIDALMTTVILDGDARGPQAGRAAYNAQPANFIYIATDIPGAPLWFSFKNSNTSGDWSSWYPISRISEGFITAAMYGGDVATAVRAAFDQRIPYVAAANENPILTLNPTTEATANTDVSRGTVFRDAVNWVQSCTGKKPKIKIADGLHMIDTYVDILNGKVEITSGSDAADLISITGASFVPTTIAGITGPLYIATVTVDTPLPARAVVGYPVGLQNCKGLIGSESIEAVNGAHKIESIATNRLSFTFTMRAHGPVLGTVTNLDNATTLSIAANKVVLPFGALSVLGDAYDGSAIEAFVNVFEDAELIVNYIGIAYRPFPNFNSEDDLLFTKGGKITGQTAVLAGAGDKVIRLANNAHSYFIRSCIGGCYTADNACQTTFGCHAVFQRCSVGGFSVDAFSTVATSDIVIDQSIVVSSLIAARTTYVSAQIEISGSTRFRYCGSALQASEGLISMLDTTSISFCDNWGLLPGKTGRIVGNPFRASNTNGENLIPGKPVSGGGWQANVARPISAYLPRILITHNFGSIPSGQTERLSGNAYADQIVDGTTYPGVKAGMNISITNVSATAAPLGLGFRAFVDGNGTFAIEATNNSSAAIDPTAIQFYIQPRWTDAA